MPEPTLQSPLATMRATVQSIESKLRHGDLPEEGLSDLKHAIADAERSAEREVTRRGAAGDITVVSEAKHRNVRVAGDSDLLLGVAVTATARGAMAL
jgi:hypothetical protein